MNGIEMIKAERERQIAKEGWTPEHDAHHILGELSIAAACYAKVASALARWKPDEIAWSAPGAWPWDGGWWKPSPDPVHNLVKAGALIAAEIDRLQSAKEATK